jgi:uncharacterized membrane protein
LKKSKIRNMVGIALMSAIVVVLQLVGSFIRFGPVSVSLVLIPIVVGAAVYGPAAGAVLGGTFGIVVLTQPDTTAFFGISVFGTVLTVMAKGILAGYLAGLVFRAFGKRNTMLGVLLAAITCPVVNTGLFVVGSRLFFWDMIQSMGGVVFLFTVMIGVNFLAELGANMLCAPVIVRIIHAARYK